MTYIDMLLSQQRQQQGTQQGHTLTYVPTSIILLCSNNDINASMFPSIVNAFAYTAFAVEYVVFSGLNLNIDSGWPRFNHIPGKILPQIPPLCATDNVSWGFGLQLKLEQHHTRPFQDRDLLHLGYYGGVPRRSQHTQGALEALSYGD